MENVAIKIVWKGEVEVTYNFNWKRKKTNKDIDYNNSARRLRPFGSGVRSNTFPDRWFCTMRSGDENIIRAISDAILTERLIPSSNIHKLGRGRCSRLFWPWEIFMSHYMSAVVKFFTDKSKRLIMARYCLYDAGYDSMLFICKSPSVNDSLLILLI